MSALDKVLLAAGAGSSAGGSAGSSAGKTAGSPKARALYNQAHPPKGHPTAESHKLHVEHVEHEEHLHHEHVEHEEHLAHEAAQGTGAQKQTPSQKASATAHKTAEATVARTRAARQKAKAAKKSTTKTPVGAQAPAGGGPAKTPGPVKATGGLAAILALAAAEEDDASSHLHGECPWFRSVNDGQAAGDFKDYCKPASGKVKLTPRTPEASTVPEPTVPPGGPGLFHIKGRELPPYIQHLWHHLAPKYGKQKAYGMAVGIVKKWAQGVNPGGWNTKSGKGKRTHPDVRAAAAKNVAMWEKDKADAHKQSASHGHG